MKKRAVLSLIILIVSAILSIVGFFVLPSRVTVNVTFDDELRYMNKLVALAVPALISIFSSLIYWNYEKLFGKDEDAEGVKGGIKYFVISVLGIILTLWVFFRNI